MWRGAVHATAACAAALGAHLVVGGAEAAAHVLVVQHLWGVGDCACLFGMVRWASLPCSSMLRSLARHAARRCMQGRCRQPRAAAATRTCTSKVKYLFRFLMIMTRKGSLMPSVLVGSAGQEMKAVDTLAPAIWRVQRGWKVGSSQQIQRGKFERGKRG